MATISADAGTEPIGSQEIDADAEFAPLTADQARAWRQRHPVPSPWRVWWLQVAVALLLAVCVAWASGQWQLAASVAWGSASVVLPAALFARALGRQLPHAQAGAALAGLFVWELVKIVLTVVMLLLAPRVVVELNWLALVAGFVVTLKVYGLAMVLGLWRPSTKLHFF